MKKELYLGLDVHKMERTTGRRSLHLAWLGPCGFFTNQSNELKNACLASNAI